MSVVVSGICIGQCYRIIETESSKCIAYDKNSRRIALVAISASDDLYDKWYFEPLPNNYFLIRNRTVHCTLAVDSGTEKKSKSKLKLDDTPFADVNDSNSFLLNYESGTVAIENKSGLINNKLSISNKNKAHFFGLQKTKTKRHYLYRLKSGTLRSLDLEDGSAETTSCCAWMENGSVSQVWRFENGPNEFNDSVFVVNNLNGRVLDIYGCQREEGAMLRMSKMKAFDDKSVTNQLWRLQFHQKLACYRIRSVHSKDMCVNIAGFDNKTMLLWEVHPAHPSNESWTFEPYFVDRPLIQNKNMPTEQKNADNDNGINGGWQIEKQLATDTDTNTFCVFGDNITDRKNHEYDYRAFCVEWFGMDRYSHLMASASPDHTVKLWNIDKDKIHKKDKTRINITAFMELLAPGWINNMKVIPNQNGDADTLQIVVTIRENKIFKYEIPKTLISPYLEQGPGPGYNHKGDPDQSKAIIRKSIDLPFGPNERSFDINNAFLYVGFNEHSSVKLAGKAKSCAFIVIDIKTGIYREWKEIQSELKAYEYVDTLKINNSNCIGIGTRNASGSKNGQFLTANIEKDGMPQIQSTKTFNTAITAIEWGKFNKIVIVGEDNGAVSILNADKLIILHSFRCHYQKISNLSLIEDLLAVASNDGDVGVHDLSAFIEEKGDEKDETVTFKESVEIIDIEGIHSGERVESIALSPNYAACYVPAAQYLLSCAYGKLDQVHVRDLCMILRLNRKKKLVQKRKEIWLKKKAKAAKMEKLSKANLSSSEVRRLDGVYKDVSGAWMDLWSKAGRMLNIINTLSKPIIASLISDKLQYLQVYNKQIIGNPMELAYYSGNDAIYGVVEKLDEMQYLIDKSEDCQEEKEKKADHDDDNDAYVMIKSDRQIHSDLLELRRFAQNAHVAVQQLSRRLAEAVHGINEDDPGVKKAPRCVEKMCTRMIQRIGSEEVLVAAAQSGGDGVENGWVLQYDFLKDVARAGVLLPDMKAIRDALFKLHQWQTGEYGEQRILEIVRFKNRFDPQYHGIFGYRDLLINLRFLNPDWLNKNKWRQIFDDSADWNAWSLNGKFEYERKRTQIVRDMQSKGIALDDLNEIADWHKFWNLICAKYKIKERNPSKHLYGAHIVELQLHHEKIHLIRQNGNGHTNYTNSRFMIDFVLQMKAIKKEQHKDPNKEKIFSLIQQLNDVSL